MYLKLSSILYMYTFRLIFSIGFLSLGSASEPEDDCFLPNPNQYYLLTTTAEGNYQNCREHRSSNGYRSAGIPPNFASRAPKGNKFVFLFLYWLKYKYQ